MTAIKTEEERARLDELYALVEAEMDHSAGSGEMPEKAEAGKGQEPFDNTRSDEGVRRFKNSFPDNPPKDVSGSSPTNCMGSPMSKTDDFYKLAALRSAEGFSAKAPGKTKNQRYYASHKEQCKAKAKEYRAANKEKERERQRKWKKANPEKFKEIQRRYIRKHRDKWNAYMREWRRKKKEAAKLQGVA